MRHLRAVWIFANTRQRSRTNFACCERERQRREAYGRCVTSLKTEYVLCVFVSTDCVDSFVKTKRARTVMVCRLKKTNKTKTKRKKEKRKEKKREKKKRRDGIKIRGGGGGGGGWGGREQSDLRAVCPCMGPVRCKTCVL